MDSVSRYWQLVRLDSAGQRRVEEVAIAKTFFHQRFVHLLAQQNSSDADLQRQLLQVLRSPETAVASSDRAGAEFCLRCAISHQIEQVCVQLAAKFGARYGFSRSDLLLIVLDDQPPSRSMRPLGPYRSLASQILQSFDPDRAGLSTWVMRQVRHHPELSAFLRERGVYLATDWGLLNDTSPTQLQRVLAEFCALAPSEIELACHLLRSYHDVYRHDRLEQRQLGILKSRDVCAPPTPGQLTRMAQAFQDYAGRTLSHDGIVDKLQTLASQLRQYRLHQLGGPLPAIPLDHPQAWAIAVEQQSPESELVPDQEQEFLQFYRQQILDCLDQALAKATSDRLIYLQRKDAQTAQRFLTAMQLFHCEGKSMGEIAPQVGLQAQFQVTRLMKLKEFRANVRSILLQRLLDCILDKAKTYTDPTRFQRLDQQIAAVLDEQVSTLLQRAEAEAAVAKQRPLTSLFARRLCHHLDTRTDYD